MVFFVTSVLEEGVQFCGDEIGVWTRDFGVRGEGGEDAAEGRKITEDMGEGRHLGTT